MASRRLVVHDDGKRACARLSDALTASRAMLMEYRGDKGAKPRGAPCGLNERPPWPSQMGHALRSWALFAMTCFHVRPMERHSVCELSANSSIAHASHALRTRFAAVSWTPKPPERHLCCTRKSRILMPGSPFGGDPWPMPSLSGRYRGVPAPVLVAPARLPPAALLGRTAMTKAQRVHEIAPRDGRPPYGLQSHRKN